MCCKKIVNNLKFDPALVRKDLNSMKKIKFKERVENARHAFFDDEDFDVNDFLICRSQNELLQSKESEEIAFGIGTLETVLKQVLLFFPGTFFLYILSMGFTVMFLISFFEPSGMTPQLGTIWLLLIFLAATLMTWLGLGDVRNPKHFVIPASIISVGVFFGTVGGILVILSNQFKNIIFSDAFLLYLFPLALIVPFLAKGWIDGKNEN